MDPSEATRDDQRASVTVDRDGIIQQWGDSVTEVVGYSADDTLGQNLNFVIPPVLRPLHWWGFDRAMRRGRLSRGTFKVPALQRRRYRRGRGHLRWCRGPMARDGVERCPCTD
jgi:PAS domain S-box-containing protein